MSAYLRWPALITTFVVIALAAWSAGPAGLALTAILITVILVAVERVWPRSADEDLRSDPQVVNDLAHATVANGGAVATDALALSAGAFVGQNLVGLEVWPSAWPLALQAGLALVLADGLEYARHRLVHRVSWLWPVHALHHSIDRLHVLKAPRNTLLDMGLRSLLVYLPLAAAGIPPTLLLLYPLANVIVGPISHSNVELRFPAWLHRLVITPPMHRLHHAKEPALSDGNFASLLPLWDMAFGTFHDPTIRPAPPVGIDEDVMPVDFARQALSPFLWRRLAGRRVSLV
jgi:sterol desaturase/sphingolipid hydroxylase (fatty acid hydroxylase superfamily)